MVSIQRGGINTGSFGVTGGSGYPGDAATGHGVREFAKWVDDFNTDKTRFLESLDKLSPVPGTDKIEFGVKARLPHRVTLGEAVDVAETTITLASGHGARVQQGQVIFIPADGTNLEEYVWVESAPSGDDITVVKGFAGSDDLAHLTGVVCECLAPAMPQLSDHPLSPVVFGDLFYNHSQRIPQKLQMDKRADVTPNLEFPDGNILEQRIEEKVEMAKVWLQKSFILGQRSPEVFTSGAKRPSTFSGLRHFCILSGNSYDLEDQLLTYYTFEEVMLDLWEEVDDEAGKAAAMHPRTKALLNMSFNPRRQATMSDTNANLTVNNVTFDVGTMETHLFRDIPVGEIYVYNPEYLAYAAVEGLDWHKAYRKAGEETAGDFDEVSVSGDFTFFAFAPSTMAIISGFETNRAAYPIDFAA
jgi:hypothetical protein